MKRFDKRKLSIVGLALALGSLLIAFQNFVPHNPFKGQNGSGLYLNGALTEALKEAEELEREKRLARSAEAQPAVEEKVQRISNAQEKQSAEPSSSAP